MNDGISFVRRCVPWFTVLLAGCGASRPAEPITQATPKSSAAPASPAAPPVDEGLSLLQAAHDDYARGDVEAAYPKAARAVGLLSASGDYRAATAIQIVGHWHLAHRDCERATAAYTQARAIRERARGPNDASIAVALVSLAEARRCAGDDVGAIANYELAYEIDSKIPDRLPDRVDTLKRLVPLLRISEDERHAEALLRDSLVAVDSARGRNDVLYFSVLGPLDSILRDRGDHVAANGLWTGIPTGEYCSPEPCPPAEGAKAQKQGDRPKPEPTSSAPRIGNATAVVAAMRSVFRACYNQGLAKDGRMTGRIEITMNVDDSGAVPIATVRRAGYLDDAVVRCVLDAVRSARFARVASGTAVVKVPVTFVPK